jgi:hypothetical protein
MQLVKGEKSNVKQVSPWVGDFNFQFQQHPFISRGAFETVLCAQIPTNKSYELPFAVHVIVSGGKGRSRIGMVILVHTSARSHIAEEQSS